MASSRERGSRSEWGSGLGNEEERFPRELTAQNVPAEGKGGKEGVDGVMRRSRWGEERL